MLLTMSILPVLRLAIISLALLRVSYGHTVHTNFMSKLRQILSQIVKICIYQDVDYNLCNSLQKKIMSLSF